MRFHVVQLGQSVAYVFIADAVHNALIEDSQFMLRDYLHMMHNMQKISVAK